MVVSRWQVEGGMRPNCLGAVRKAGIRCPNQLVVGGKHDGGGGAGGAGGAGAAGVLSKFYVLINRTKL